jgi:hypothetical protein
MEPSREHVKALEAEISMLRQRVAQKDKTILKITGEKDSEIAEKEHKIQRLCNGKLDQAKVYHLLEPTLIMARRGYSATSSLPLVGPLVRFGIRVMDVGVKRLTPWSSCAELDKNIVSLMPYLDEKVISPQINAYCDVAVALCGPTVEAGRGALTPYYLTAQGYATRVKIVAQPALAKLEPYAAKIDTAVRPLVSQAWERLRPWVWKIEARVAAKVCDVVEEVNALEIAALERVDPTDIFQTACDDAKAVVEFVQDHADDVRDAAARVAELVADTKHTEDMLKA